MNKKQSLISIIIIIFMFIIIPINVSAAGIDYGDCINGFGSIKWVNNGNDNRVLGNINYSNTKNNSKWSMDTVTFDVEVQAPISHKVQKVNYSISSFGDKSCRGSITGSIMDSNTGSVKFSVVLDKGYIDHVTFSGVTINRKDSSERASASSEKLSVKKESREGENAENDGMIDDLTPDDGKSPSDAMKKNCDTGLKTLINKYWKWIVFITPLLLLVMITIDFLKAMAANDSDLIKKSSSNAVKRVIAALVLLALPWALDAIFGLFGLEICL